MLAKSAMLEHLMNQGDHNTLLYKVMLRALKHGHGITSGPISLDISAHLDACDGLRDMDKTFVPCPLPDKSFNCSRR